MPAEATGEAAHALARRLGGPVCGQPPATGLYLRLDGEGLALCEAGRPPMCVRAEFLDGPPAQRAARQGHQREAIARACGVSRAHQPWIVDATAGLGRDAFVLATAGATVTLLERSAVVQALLTDGLERAAAGDSMAVARMTAVQAEAVEWLSRSGGETRPAVVYLDPMYQGRRRAAAGKALTLLQTLLGPADDDAALLSAALTAATRRVVVKRHRHAAPLAGSTPDFRLPGRSTRFDVYQTGKD